MTEWMLAVGLAVAGFFASNLDNLVLMAILRASGASAARITLGYFTALLVVLVIASGAGWLLARWSARMTGWLGLIPLSLGVAGLLRMHLAGATAAAEAGTMEVAPGYAAIAMLMIATSGDSIALFTATFADTDSGYWAAMAVAVLAAGVAWSAIANGLGARIGANGAITRYATRLVPWIMMAIGAYILLDTPTDLL